MIFMAGGRACGAGFSWRECRKHCLLFFHRGVYPPWTGPCREGNYWLGDIAERVNRESLFGGARSDFFNTLPNLSVRNRMWCQSPLEWSTYSIHAHTNAMRYARSSFLEAVPSQAKQMRKERTPCYTTPCRVILLCIRKRSPRQIRKKIVSIINLHDASPPFPPHPLRL